MKQRISFFFFSKIDFISSEIVQNFSMTMTLSRVLSIKSSRTSRNILVYVIYCNHFLPLQILRNDVLKIVSLKTEYSSAKTISYIFDLFFYEVSLLVLLYHCYWNTLCTVLCESIASC